MITLILSVTIGCNPDSGAEGTNNKNDVEYTQVRTNTLDQQASNHIKEKLSENNEVTAIYAVNTAKTIVVAMEFHQIKQLQLPKLRKKYTTKIEEMYPNHKVEVSTDQKLIFELERLEEKIDKNDISQKKLKKEIKDLTKLMKEKT